MQSQACARQAPPRLEQKGQRLGVKEKLPGGRRKTLERELERARMAPRTDVARSKARLKAKDEMAARKFEECQKERPPLPLVKTR